MTKICGSCSSSKIAGVISVGAFARNGTPRIEIFTACQKCKNYFRKQGMILNTQIEINKWLTNGKKS